MSRLLSALEELLAWTLRAALVFAGLALALLMVVEIVLRYWLELPFLGIEEISVLLGLWLYFLGAAYVTRENAHIKGGIADLLIKDRAVLRRIRFAGTLVCLGASGVFAYLALTYARFVMSTTRSSAYLHWPTGIWVASIAVGFSLVVLYFLLHAIRQWREIRQPG